MSGSAAPRALHAKRATTFMGWGFVAPTLLLLLTVNLFPLIFNVYLSLTNADLSGGAIRNVGAHNYTVIFRDVRFANPLTLTALFVLVSVSVELVLGFWLALALRDRVPGKPVMLTILLIPMMLSPGGYGAVLEPDPERQLRRPEPGAGAAAPSPAAVADRDRRSSWSRPAWSTSGCGRRS